ncbi:uncharacterized protein LOC129604841 isoform X2 [Betta splendens]|uniref:Uncharacterized protein LOC129604841 isoform X2 n=1 Tax=Betta splendens TaxID=158456 RepID=A0A9W2Y4K9_BETSP|nr:uncharacterized protein LOC129604841 isoform X2 [Betta splendens]
MIPNSSVCFVLKCKIKQMHFTKSPSQPSVRLSDTTSPDAASPSSPSCCQASGSCPDRTESLWTNGDQIHEEVDREEGLSVPDGAVQVADDLDLSVKPEVKHDIPRAEQQTGPGGCGLVSADVIGIVVAVALAVLFIFIIIIGFITFRTKVDNKQLHSSREFLVLMRDQQPLEAGGDKGDDELDSGFSTR